MTYNNLTNEVTSVQGTWTIGGTFSYSTLQLQSGIIHKDQLEVERIFELPTSASVTPGPVTVNIKDNISTHDLHRIFIVNKDDYTVNETTKAILTLTPSSPTIRYYTFEKGSLAGKTYAIPTITSTEVVVVRRKTVSNTSYVSWSAGSRLTSDQLNLQISQLLKLNQEIIYKLESEYLRTTDISGSSAPSFSISNDLDMGGNKILTLGNPTASFNTDLQTAVNKAYIESHFVNLDQSQNQTINGNKTFSGTTTFTGAIAANGGFTCDSTAFSVADTSGNTSIGGTLTVTNQTNLNGGLNLDSGAFTVADTTGDTVVGGTLQVNGASTLASASVTGALTVDTNTLVVDASNNRVGIGTAAPSVNLHVVATTNPIIASDATSTAGVSQVRAISDGAAIDLRSYGTTASTTLAGLPRADLTAVYAATPTNLLIATSTAAPISFATTDVVRITIPASTSGIQFPASPTLSADANTLDTYVEGTHTILAAHISGSGGSYTSVTLDNSNADFNKVKYTRIGNFILFNCTLKLSAITVGSGSGIFQITNLPWTASEPISLAANVYPVFFLDMAQNLIINLISWAGGSSFRFGYRTASNAFSVQNLEGVNVTAGTYLSFSGCVRV